MRKEAKLKRVAKHRAEELLSNKEFQKAVEGMRGKYEIRKKGEEEKDRWYDMFYAKREKFKSELESKSSPLHTFREYIDKLCQKYGVRYPLPFVYMSNYKYDLLQLLAKFGLNPLWESFVEACFWGYDRMPPLYPTWRSRHNIKGRAVEFQVIFDRYTPQRDVIRMLKDIYSEPKKWRVIPKWESQVEPHAPKLVAQEKLDNVFEECYSEEIPPGEFIKRACTKCQSLGHPYSEYSESTIRVYCYDWKKRTGKEVKLYYT